MHSKTVVLQTDSRNSKPQLTYLLELMKGQPEEFSKRSPIQMEETSSALIYRTLKQINDGQKAQRKLDALKSLQIEWD